MPKSDKKDNLDSETKVEETGDKEDKSDASESKRISDLMSKWQTEEAARKRLEAEKQKAEEELEKLKVSQMSESEKLRYELDTERNRAQRLEQTVSYYELERKKQEVLKEFPRASKLQDLIYGKSEDEIRAVAQDIENRLKGEESSSNPSSETGEETPPPVDLDNPQVQKSKKMTDEDFGNLPTKEMKKLLPVKED